MGSRGSKLLFSIHSLRFLAASGVVVHHSGVLIPFNNILLGAAGVDLFFVISGVVIGMTGPHMRVSDFLSRRFIRVFPLYWIATAAMIAHAAYVGATYSSEHIVLSLLLIPPDLSSKWFPIYFPAWTLTFEILFYAVFTLCMFVRHPRIVCCVVLTIAAFVLFDPMSPNYCRNFSMLLLEFVAGVLISITIERGWVPNRAFGTLLICIAIALFIRNATSHGAREIGWGIPSALLVFGALAFESAHILRHPIIVLGGHASYAIYLFHITFIELTRTVFLRNGVPVEQYPHLYAAIVILGSIILGMAIYVALDRPLLSWMGKRLVRRAAPA